MVLTHVFASSLFGLEVIAIDSRASFATLIFEIVLPEIEIKKTL